MRAGRPRSRGDLLPLMGWGDGRVGAGDRYFFMNIDAQDAQDFLQEAAVLYSWESAIPHRTIARAGFRCNNLSSCLSCASCASMLIIRLVATRAVEAAPSRFVALPSAADRHFRNAAFAPLRLDCGLRPLADSPSRGE